MRAPPMRTCGMPSQSATYVWYIDAHFAERPEPERPSVLPPSSRPFVSVQPSKGDEVDRGSGHSPDLVTLVGPKNATRCYTRNERTRFSFAPLHL